MPEVPVDFTEDADTDEEIWAEAAERLRIAEEIESPNRLLAIEDLEFEDGQQWPDAQRLSHRCAGLAVKSQTQTTG